MKHYIKKHLREGLTRDEQNNIDSILDKISSKGIESLSPLEKEILDSMGSEDNLPSPAELKKKQLLQDIDRGIKALQTAVGQISVKHVEPNDDREVIVKFMTPQGGVVAHMTQHSTLLVNMPVWKYLSEDLGVDDPIYVLQHMFSEWARREFSIDIKAVLPMTL